MEMLSLGVSAAGLALAGLAGWLLVGRRRLRAEELERRLAALERDLRALCATQARVGDRLRDAEAEIRRLGEVQGRLEMKAPGNGAYRQAETLAAHGASVEELVATCGIGRGEAALLRLVHHRGAAGGGLDATSGQARQQPAFLG